MRARAGIRRRRWTEAEDRAVLRADRPRKDHVADCAAALGRSVAAVRRRAQRLRAGGRWHSVAGSRDNGAG